ncbi:MAG: DNA polymerase III subunit delta [Erysipelotrichaceae bacterium]|nr:DNA polymerase III subunit delta [Erysipelotrichaceae bacterium]
MVAKQLKEQQPIIYQIFVNALELNQISHAYLLSGEAGTPILKTAYLLAKSLVCENQNPLACSTCSTCRRINEGNYTDFVFLDGSSETIKKEAVQALAMNFEKTSVESAGKLIYIIHLVENMTAEAVNALLKFLEEPQPNVYAFLTTENEAKVLPTILSRSQILRLRLISEGDVIEEAVNLGVEELDAQLLVHFYNDAQSLLEVSESDEYLAAKDALLSFLDALAISSHHALYTSQTVATKLISSTKAARFYLDLISIILNELVRTSLNQETKIDALSYKYKAALANVSDPSKALLTTLEARSRLDFNVNLNLTLDYVALAIIKDD